MGYEIKNISGVESDTNKLIISVVFTNGKTGVVEVDYSLSSSDILDRLDDIDQNFKSAAEEARQQLSAEVSDLIGFKREDTESA